MRIQQKPSPNFNARPQGERISLLVIHSISLPPGQYGGRCIEALFQNRLHQDPICLAQIAADQAQHGFERERFWQSLRGLRVSSHYVIERDGTLVQYVADTARAWHAGASKWVNVCGEWQEGCNDYAIGVELEGLEGEPFETVQYHVLADLAEQLNRRWGIRHLAGHQHIAPNRKGDPGAGFDWHQFRLWLSPATQWILPQTILGEN